MYSTAAKADDGESAVSLNTAVAGWTVPDHQLVGGVVGAEYERGVTDLLWLRASAAGGPFYNSGTLAYAGISGIGITYVLDVLRYVPRIDLGIGALVVGGTAIDTEITPLIELGVGVDILVSPKRSHGVFARFESFLGRSAYFSVGVRTTWRWGFF